ncbi:MAG: protein kinase [Lentisphaeraceae bacterium]|nr:protein kinase [Lentisphaeraceae bacterium]
MDDDKNNWLDLFERANEDGRSESLLHKLSHIEQRYHKLDLLGSGAMKNVIRTEDVVSGRTVAKAVLKHSGGEQVIEAFLREARITAQLQHPNIVPVYDMGFDDEGNPFFTMKLIKGLTLEDILTKLQENDSDFINAYPLPKLIDIFLKVCEAMAYAHSEGIVHLDLKPANIQASAYGEVIICDWGLASFIANNDDSEDATKEHYEYFEKRYSTLRGEIKGTPGYMAPEQARGGKQVKDERTDIFALGAILYELLTDRRAIKGESLKDILLNTTEGVITPPAKRRADLQLPSSLEAVCMKALEVDASKRYQDVESIIADIDAYRLGFATAAEDVSFMKQVSLLYKRHRHICLVVFFLLSVMIAGSLFFIDSLREKEKVTALALETLKQQQELTKRISKEASITYADKAQAAYKSFDNVKARYILQTALSLDPQNKDALEVLARIQCAQQEFSEAHEKFLALNNFSQKDLRKFCLVLSQSEHKKPLGIQELYPFVKKFLKGYRHLLKSQLFAWAIMRNDKLEDIESDIVWLLSMENNKDVHCELVGDIDGFRLDLSGNGSLNDIRSIGSLAIKHLDLRGCRVTKQGFLGGFPKIKQLLVDKEQVLKMWLFGKAKITRY